MSEAKDFSFALLYDLKKKNPEDSMLNESVILNKGVTSGFAHLKKFRRN